MLKGQRSRSRGQVMYQQQRRHNMAKDRFSDFTWHDVIIKAVKDWRGVGPHEVAMHSQLPRFLVSFFFYQYTAVSSSTGKGHQIYSEGLVVGETIFILRDLAHPSPNCHMGQKCFMCDITQLWATRVWKFNKISELWNKSGEWRWWPIYSPSLVEFGPCTPENRPDKVPHPVKLDGKNVLYRQRLSRGLIDFVQIWYKFGITRQSGFDKTWRSRDYQRILKIRPRVKLNS